MPPLSNRRGNCRAVALLKSGSLALAPLKKRLKSVALNTASIRVSAFALDPLVPRCREMQRARSLACSRGKMLIPVVSGCLSQGCRGSSTAALEGTWMGNDRLGGDSQLIAEGGRHGQWSPGCELEEGFRGREDVV